MKSISTSGPAKLVLTGGNILTGEQGGRAEAIYVADGRVVAIGSESDVTAAAGADVPRQDLGGATVIPGMIDTHPHLMHFAAFYGATVNILESKDYDEITAAIKERAANTPAGEWITTTPVGEPHYFLRRSWRDLEEGQLPNRHVLDEATSDHPVIIQAWAPTTPNVCALNSLALERLGITADSPDRIENIWIEKDADGVPTGILTGSVTTYYNDDPYWLTLQEKMPPLIQSDVIPAAHAASMAHYQRSGVTTIFEAHDMDVPLIEAYKYLRANGLLGLRVIMAHSLESNALPGSEKRSMQEIRDALELALADRSTTDDWLRVDGITTNAWGPGSCGRMGWLRGYLDAWGNQTNGRRQITKEKMDYAIDWCAEHGLQLNLLAASPDEIDEYIAGARNAIARHGLDQLDWMIQHGYIMRPGQAEQLAELGFDITVSAGFSLGKGEMIEERMGKDALSWLNTFRTFIDAGMKVAGSSDWGPVNPFEQMQLAVTHEMQPSGRRNDGPAQVVSRDEAFEMWTSGGAALLKWDGVGVLRPGAYADLAIVDRDPVRCDIAELPSTKVLATMIDGRVVHDTGVLSGDHS